MNKIVIKEKCHRLIADDKEICFSLIVKQRDQLVSFFSRYKGGTVAILSKDVSLIIAALLAAQEADVSLFLVRSTLSVETLIEIGCHLIVRDENHLECINPVIAEPCTPGVLIQTSGTTGIPKIARHKLTGLLGRIRTPKNSENARWLLAYDPKSFAGFQVILTFLLGGGVMIYSNEPTISKLIHVSRVHQPNLISATPTFWKALAMAGGVSLPLRAITLGGEVSDQALLDRLVMLYPNAAIQHIYASTEAGALFSVRDKMAGFPVSWLETGIDGVELRINNSSILEVKSPRRMQGYLGNHKPPLTDDGWIVTGDLVRIEDTRVLFSGRKDSIINVGGGKVRPEEVESVACMDPNVVNALAYGKKNPILGQLVAIDITVKQGSDEQAIVHTLEKMFEEKLERYKVPRIIRVVDKLEINSTGKKVRR